MNLEGIDGDKPFDWEQEHQALLERIAPESFEVLHHAALAELRVRKG